MVHMFFRFTFRLPTSSGCWTDGALLDAPWGLVAHIISFDTIEFCQGKWADILPQLTNSQVESGKERPGGDWRYEGVAGLLTLESGEMRLRFFICRCSVSKPPRLLLGMPQIMTVAKGGAPYQPEHSKRD